MADEACGPAGVVGEALLADGDPDGGQVGSILSVCGTRNLVAPLRDRTVLGRAASARASMARATAHGVHDKHD